MKIASINVDSWSTDRFMVTLDGGTCIHIDMTEDESNRIRQIAIEIFQSRQKSLVNEIRDAGPALLADFSEVPSTTHNIDDDMPF